MKRINGNLQFEKTPRIVSFASAVGKKEGEGPLGNYFDRVIHDSYVGKDTFEQAESELLSTAVRIALNKGDFESGDIDIACCGDLLNQCVASSFAMRPYGIPYAGVYGACSTMALAMIVAAMAVESGAAERAVCAASSHYCTAERQYRFPLEYGSRICDYHITDQNNMGAAMAPAVVKLGTKICSHTYWCIENAVLSSGLTQIVRTAQKAS